MTPEYSKLQFILLELIEEKTLKEVIKTYFPDHDGIGYWKRVITGKAKPMEPMIAGMLKKVPKKYHKAYDKYVEYEKSFKGW